MKALELLKREINEALSYKGKPDSWGMPQLMTKALASVRSTFDKPSDGHSDRSIAKTLISFRRTLELPTFLDVKYACIGIGQQIGTDGWHLMIDDKCFAKLLSEVENLQSEPRRLRKCYQGLLSGYFGYPILSGNVPDKGYENWRILRVFLKDRLHVVLRVTPVASWAQLLNHHMNLLNDQPCACYGAELIAGNSNNLKDVCEGLGIPSDSWVWLEAVLAQIETACSFPDEDFKKQLDNLIELSTGGKNISISDYLMTQCIAVLVIRYSQCSSRPEHMLLRDAAVTKIGNPWLRRVAWDAHVKNEEARKMVDGWLKRRLITDFFALLSEDGSADKRRLNYWLRFEDQIEDMWFALGPYARQQRSSEFRKIRELAKGRLLSLENGGKSENNAFIMRVGGLVVVEFGAKGNACYIFDYKNLPFDLNKSYVRGNNTELKSRSYGQHFIHRDFETTGTSWEEKLDEWLFPYLGWLPSKAAYSLSSRTSSHRINRSSGNSNLYQNRDEQVRRPKDFIDMADFESFLTLNNLHMVDERHIGGALWVFTDNSRASVNLRLSAWSFKYKHLRGWWKE